MSYYQMTISYYLAEKCNSILKDLLLLVTVNKLYTVNYGADQNCALHLKLYASLKTDCIFCI